MNYRERINELKSKYNSHVMIKENRENRMKELQADLSIIDKSQAICNAVAKDTQSMLSVKADDIVNLCLETCYPNQYKFHLDFETVRGKSEVRFNFYDKINKCSIDDIMNVTGGGLTDIVSIALRLVAYSLSDTDNVLILDEPCKFVSADLRNKVGEMLSMISHNLNLQIICVTHIEELKEHSDKQFVVKKINGVSEVCDD